MAESHASDSTNGTKPPARDSKGWDGKLRVGRAAEEDEAQREQPTPPDSEDDNEPNADTPHSEAPPGMRILNDPAPGSIAADEDLLADVAEDETDIDLNHHRISSISALRLERFKKLERLCLRQNQISSLHFPPDWGDTVQELDLYDNGIAHIKHLEGFTNLTSLDLSFNSIKHIKNVNHLAALRDLFFVQNRIAKIEGLEGLASLRNLELGGNRVREIENLDTLAGLEELWLGKNKITQLSGLASLSSLRLLSIQSNRLTSDTLGHLATLPNLEELYISHNALTTLAPLAPCTKIRMLDVSSNPIVSAEGVGALTVIEEFWASDCKLDSFEEIEKELGNKEELTTVYLEGNPLQRRQPVLYRNKVRLALPQIKQIDATYVRVD